MNRGLHVCQGSCFGFDYASANPSSHKYHNIERLKALFYQYALRTASIGCHFLHVEKSVRLHPPCHLLNIALSCLFKYFNYQPTLRTLTAEA